jgi:hypothetical protein
MTFIYSPDCKKDLSTDIYYRKTSEKKQVKKRKKRKKGMSSSNLVFGSGEHGPDLNFRDFSYAQTQNNQYQPYEDLSRQPEPVSLDSIRAAFGTAHYHDEQPLLEELGINLYHIFTKVSTN